MTWPLSVCGFEMSLQRRLDRLEAEYRQRVDAIEGRMFAAVANTPGMDALAALGAWGLFGTDPEPLSAGALAVCGMEPAALYDLYAATFLAGAGAVTDGELALCGFADRATLKRDLEANRDEMIARIAECQRGAYGR